MGRIVPVLHYTMGGIRMDEKGRVVRADGSVIDNLSAAGEVRVGDAIETRDSPTSRSRTRTGSSPDG